MKEIGVMVSIRIIKSKTKHIDWGVVCCTQCQSTRLQFHTSGLRRKSLLCFLTLRTISTQRMLSTTPTTRRTTSDTGSTLLIRDWVAVGGVVKRGVVAVEPQGTTV